MVNMTEVNEPVIEIEKMSIDQFAGSVVLILGAIGSLLLVIWQSKCACKCRIGFSDNCYIFDCSREPPTPEEQDKLKDEVKQKEKKMGPVGQANTTKRNKVPAEDRLVPEEIRNGTFPGADNEPEPEPEAEAESEAIIPETDDSPPKP